MRAAWVNKNIKVVEPKNQTFELKDALTDSVDLRWIVEMIILCEFEWRLWHYTGGIWPNENVVSAASTLCIESRSETETAGMCSRSKKTSLKTTLILCDFMDVYVTFLVTVTISHTLNRAAVTRVQTHNYNDMINDMHAFHSNCSILNSIVSIVRFKFLLPVPVMDSHLSLFWSINTKNFHFFRKTNERIPQRDHYYYTS